MTTTTESDLFLMANLFPKHTGLPFIVWVSVRGKARHDIRVKISVSTKVKPDELISVGLRPTVHEIGGDRLNATDLGLLKNWVHMNFDVLLSYWEERIDTIELGNRLKTLLPEPKRNESPYEGQD